MLGFFNVENCVLKGCGEFFYRYHEERSLSCLFQHVALCTLSWESARSYLCSVNCCRFLTSLRVERYRGRWGLSGCILPQQGAQNRRGPLLGKLPVLLSTFPLIRNIPYRCWVICPILTRRCSESNLSESNFSSVCSGRHFLLHVK